jgi:hypothetical protein
MKNNNNQPFQIHWRGVTLYIVQQVVMGVSPRMAINRAISHYLSDIPPMIRALVMDRLNYYADYLVETLTPNMTFQEAMRVFHSAAANARERMEMDNWTRGELDVRGRSFINLPSHVQAKIRCRKSIQSFQFRG